jgi:hypothetical protein
MRKSLSTATRARLEATFKRAKEDIAFSQRFDFAIELLGICVLGDPANPIYVRAYLEGVQKQRQRKKIPVGRYHGTLKNAIANSQWDEVIRHGLEVLKADPWDVVTLTQMAMAAKASGDSDSTLCYLKVALTKSPKDPTCNRMAALVLDDMGLVNQAIVFWQRVAEALPKDKQAKEAIYAFQVGAKSQGVAAPKQPTAEEQEELIRQREAQRQKELARQQKIREEEEREREELARLQEDVDEPAEADDEISPMASVASAKTAKMPGINDMAFQEGYDYGIEETPEPVVGWKSKTNLTTMAVMLVTWLTILVFVAIKWGAGLWKNAKWPWWAWIVLGIGMLIVAAGIRKHPQRR